MERADPYERQFWLMLANVGFLSVCKAPSPGLYESVGGPVAFRCLMVIQRF